MYFRSIVMNRHLPLFNILKKMFCTSISSFPAKESQKVIAAGKEYYIDHMTNVTPTILSKVGKNLHLHNSHPLGQLCKRLIHFMYERFRNLRGNPLFSVYNRLPPVVTVEQNFDSLLIPQDHIARHKRDNYYVNSNYLLRAHTTAHQVELIKMGLNNALIVGDVYRRDSIDSSHYPVFHQADAFRLLSEQDLYGHIQDSSDLPPLFENRPETDKNQSCHSDAALAMLTTDLQDCLLSLAVYMFGKDLEYRWVDSVFPFTHPSWELEVKFDDEWVELLGCGIIRQEILYNCGAGQKIGWAFGLGLERWAMKLYSIPDIRLFWSTDDRFFSQFNFEDPNTPVVFQPFSKQPPVVNDISFWLPPEGTFQSEDFYDLVRSVGENLVEKVELIDQYTNKKKQLTSHCYRITYRSWERVLTQKEVNDIHQRIEMEASNTFGVTVR